MFISFEGCEGSGKSTQIKLLYEFLEYKNIPVISTKEIGGSIEADKIKDLLLNYDLCKTSQMLLIMASRFEHTNKVIIPALLNNTWVICDRYIDSTCSYQSNDMLSIKEIYEMHDKYIGIYPDITFFIDTKPEIGLERIKNRNNNNKFDEKDITFHNNIYNNYNYISSINKDRIKVINDNKKEIVLKDILLALNLI